MRSPRSHPRVAPSHDTAANAPQHTLDELFHIILHNEVCQATKWKERCTSNQRRPPFVGVGEVQMDMHERPVVLNKRACTYATSGPFVYNINSIQKLKSPKNWRSIQTSTLCAGLTNTNDVRIDTSRPHQLWTHEQARPK